MLNAFYILWRSFFNICLFRSGPQDLPGSWFFTQVSLIIYTLVAIILSMFQLPVIEAIAGRILETALLIILTASLLYLTRHFARLPQTLTALAGIGIIFNILVSITYLFFPLPTEPPINLEILFPYLLISCWNLAITAHIFRHALSASFGIGLVVALTCSMFIFVIIIQLFPPATT